MFNHHNKLRLGIFGAGYFANKALKQLSNSKTIEIVGIASKSNNPEFAPFDVPYFNSYESLLNLERVDAIYICNALPFHAASIQLVLENSLNCICEKPIAKNPDDLDTLSKISYEQNVFLTESMWPIYMQHYRRLFKIVSEGQIGVPVKCRIVMSKHLDRTKSKRVFSQFLGGGLLYDYSIYALHFALALYSSTGNPINYYEITLTKIDDYSGEYHISWNNSFILDVTYSSSDSLNDEIEILGTLGGINISGNLLNPTDIVVNLNEVNYSLPIEENPNFLIPQFDYFIENIGLGLKESKLLPISSSKLVLQLLAEIGQNYID